MFNTVKLNSLLIILLLLLNTVVCSPSFSANSTKPLKRKIAMVYQSKSEDFDQKLGSALSNYFSMPLNHYGYITVLYNMNDALPNITEEYAGVVVFNTARWAQHEDELLQWYKTIIQQKVPLVLLGNLGFSANNNRLKPLDLSAPSYFNEHTTLKISYQSPMMGYERQPFIRANELIPIRLNKGSSLLRVKDSFGMTYDIAALTPWGGYYLNSNILVPSNIDGFYQWTINPFDFLHQALRLKDIPVPDVTTENGSRLMMVHIDGDGFGNPAGQEGSPFVSQVMYDEFIQKYKIPTTVSIIQGELAENGVQPKLTPLLEPLARKIFASPYVEAATHTFSHPFIWTYAERNKEKTPNPYTLPIKNYKFDLFREINGSVDYINQKLVPMGKRCMAMLWSGEGDASAQALKYTYDLGLANINPGRIVTNFHRSVSRVSAFGIFIDSYYQMFAPIGNDHETFSADNVFLYSIIQILHALQITDKPRRLKAIDIYLHFYSVAQEGGIKAMHKVYEWALSTPVMNLFVSDFFKKIQDFNQLKIYAKDKGWLIKSQGFLREFRIPRQLGYPDLLNSQNLIGYSDYNDARYIHLGPLTETFIILTNKPSSLPYLKSSNAWVAKFIREGDIISFTLEAYMPIKMTLANMQGCSLSNKNILIEPTNSEANDRYYEFKFHNRHEFIVKCNA